MHRVFKTLSFLLASAAIVACSDDASDSPAGQAGSSQGGSGGSSQAGQGGSSQAGSGGSEQAGSAGSAQAGQGGSAQAGSSQAGEGGSSQAGQAGSSQAGQSGGGQGGGSGVEAEVVVKLDAKKNELPEGLAIRGNDAVLGFALTGAIERFALADGARTPFASVPPPPPNTSFLTGIGFDGEGLLYGALVSFTDALAPGIYRSAGASGGEAKLWASHASMKFPNGLAWDDAGVLYVTDSAYGGVFRVAKDGTAEPWASDDRLKGNPPACGEAADALSVGANGIVWTKQALYVAGNDQGVLMRIPIDGAGKAGAPELAAGPDCAALAGLDGIALDTDGSIVGAVNRANRIVRIKDGKVTTLFEGAPLDFPATVAFAGEGSQRALYVTSFALGAFMAGQPANPALVRLRLGP